MIIVKMQRSITTSDNVQKVLVYNQAKTINYEAPMNADIAKWFGDKSKVYAKASYKGGHLSIHGLVKAQPW
jgi:hypothetical protein